MQAALQCLPDPAKKCVGNALGIKPKNRKRGGVSAEAMGNDAKDEETVVVRTVEKSARTREQLLAITADKTLFAGCTESQMEAVIDAMFEVSCKAAQVVIAQGDMGE